MKRAQIVFNNGGSSYFCTVRDLSDHGARLVADEWFACPNDVDLKFLEGLERFGAPVNCRIAWHNVYELGVQFQPN